MGLIGLPPRTQVMRSNVKLETPPLLIRVLSSSQLAVLALLRRGLMQVSKQMQGATAYNPRNLNLLLIIEPLLGL